MRCDPAGTQGLRLAGTFNLTRRYSVRLRRRGARRFHRWTRIFDKEARVLWNAERGQLTLDVSYVAAGLNKFDYEISLTLAEVQQIVEALWGKPVAEQAT